MTAHWIHLNDNCRNDGETLRVTGPEAEHAARAKRLRPGEAVTLFAGDGRLIHAVIVEAHKHFLRLRPMREQTVAPPRPAVHLHVAPPKGERAERLLDAASQLGAASVTCLRTARSVVEPRPGKQERWRRLAIESAKQCRRAHLLELRPPVDFRKALERAATAGPVVVLHAAGDPYQVNDTRVEGEVALFVGPEGGWTDEELTIARDHDAAIVRLTGYTLRIETAALAGLAVITQYHDDLNQRED